MKKLSIRGRSGTSYEIGPAGIGRTVVVQATSKRVALERGKREFRIAHPGYVPPVRKSIREGRSVEIPAGQGRRER